MIQLVVVRADFLDIFDAEFALQAAYTTRIPPDGGTANPSEKTNIEHSTANIQ